MGLSLPLCRPLPHPLHLLSWILHLSPASVPLPHPGPGVPLRRLTPHPSSGPGCLVTVTASLCGIPSTFPAAGLSSWSANKGCAAQVWWFTQHHIVGEPGHPHDPNPRAPSRTLALGPDSNSAQASGGRHTGWRAHRARKPLHPECTPFLVLLQISRGSQGPASPQVRGPGGRQARGCGLRLFKTLGLRHGVQVTRVPPILSLLGQLLPWTQTSTSLCSVLTEPAGVNQGAPRPSVAPGTRAQLSLQLLKWICSVTMG